MNFTHQHSKLTSKRVPQKKTIGIKDCNLFCSLSVHTFLTPERGLNWCLCQFKAYLRVKSTWLKIDLEMVGTRMRPLNLKSVNEDGKIYGQIVPSDRAEVKISRRILQWMEVKMKFIETDLTMLPAQDHEGLNGKAWKVRWGSRSLSLSTFQFGWIFKFERGIQLEKARKQLNDEPRYFKQLPKIAYWGYNKSLDLKPPKSPIWAKKCGVGQKNIQAWFMTTGQGLAQPRTHSKCWRGWLNKIKISEKVFSPQKYVDPLFFGQISGPETSLVGLANYPGILSNWTRILFQSQLVGLIQVEQNFLSKYSIRKTPRWQPCPSITVDEVSSPSCERVYVL